MEAFLDFDDPRLHERANGDWYRLSVEGGLFSGSDRRFLLPGGLVGDGSRQWVCVELQDEWDVMGEGARGLLGSAHCRPEFRMLSLDGSVLVFATTWQYGLSTSVLADPGRSQVLRRFAEWVALGAMDGPGGADGVPVSVAARRWLDGC
ncbi:hypothetical protein [Streptomyces venezuelae]|uniref:hypothetical protein n=1 Tax=Streptomyces venezuelae TaxID=54571 RepID=UPI001CC258CC|nr:hypothetical protein [Streptomyces venezuelae]